MTKLNEIYKCAVCGNIVEILHAAQGELVCCAQPMKLLVENTVDAAKEKHVPVIEKTETGYLVKVGAVEHPATPEHHIEFIELICLECGKVMRKQIPVGDHPQAEFCTNSKKVIAREYCNLHGLWKSEN
ncbi:superoxide reductase [Elusimicrobium posterum]|uniref:desulfoferrodoxin n=1 Tax=Elusimicrobium posterum TaxID=3116653 RepID=UPI003C737FE4